eukprot:5040882-Pyramimonas_sp.AAC.1
MLGSARARAWCELQQPTGLRTHVLKSLRRCGTVALWNSVAVLLWRTRRTCGSSSGCVTVSLTVSLLLAGGGLGGRA